MKKTVLKVDIKCIKCKAKIMKAVAKLSGVDQIAVDEGKGTLTVIGVVDPVAISYQMRKIGQDGTIITVGPPKPDQSQDKSKEKWLPSRCDRCQLVWVGLVPYEDYVRPCTIL